MLLVTLASLPSPQLKRGRSVRDCIGNILRVRTMSPDLALEILRDTLQRRLAAHESRCAAHLP